MKKQSKFISDWETYNNDDAPSKNGISAGKNHLGEQIYVGSAIYSNEKAPAELVVDGENRGIHFSYGGKVHHLTSDLKYYVKENTCDYQWVSSSNGEIVENAIDTKDSYENVKFYAGRIYDHDSYHVGKVSFAYKDFFYGYKGVEKSSNTYEVLVCNKVTPLKTATSFSTRNNPISLTWSLLPLVLTLLLKMIMKTMW